MGLYAAARDFGVIVLGTSLVACTSWRVQDVPPAEVVQQKAPGHLRVSRGDGSVVVIDDPRLGGDSLVGNTHGSPVAIPLAEVRQVAVRKGDAVKTVVLIGGVTGALFALGAVAMQDCCASGFSFGD